MKKVLFTATVDSHILAFHIPYLKYFKEKGYEVHVATNGNANIPYCDKKIIIPFERSPFKTKNIKAYKSLKKIIKSENYDIIHTHTPVASVITRLASKKERKKGTRIIYTAHGFHFYKGASIRNWLLFYPVEKYLSKYIDTLITINEEDYNFVKRKFKKCNDIKYVPGVGVDEQKFNFIINNKEKIKLRKDLGLNENDFVMIFPAELNQNKNQIFIINVMEKLIKKYENIHLLLPGKDSYGGHYQKIVKEKNLQKNIHFLGYREDIPKLLKISDLSIATSKREGLPVNIIEAMCVKLPIVATNCRGHRELIKDGINGFLVDINDEKELENKIVYLYENSDVRKKMGENGASEFKKYSLLKIYDEMCSIYNPKKNIAFLRCTPIYNDSRALKEVQTYSRLNNNVLVWGWNRNCENIDINKLSLPNNCKISFYNKKALYGSGYKNIINILKFNIWIYKKLKENKTKIDYIHACDFDTAYIATKFAKKYNKKVIYDIYDYYVDSHNLGPLKNIVERLDIKTINKSDFTIICTEQRKKQINKSNPKNIVVIHNSPNYQKDYEITNQKKNKGKIRIGYFGILQDDRLLIEITDLIKNNNKYELYVGGFGKYQEYFELMSKKYSNITFFGSLPYKSVIEKEKECDVLFATYNPKITNHMFSAPNKVYESMALGKPIIVCENTGIDELVNKEKLGYVIKYDAKEFINKLDKLDNIDINRIQQIFKKNYSWDVMENKFKDMLIRLGDRK